MDEMSRNTSVTLANGIERSHIPTPSPTTTILLTVSEGLIHDAPDRLGERHLLEHLFFSRRTDGPDIAEQIEALGGAYNAHVRKEYSSYWIDCLPEYGEKAVELIAYLISNPTWDKTVIQSEQKIMTEEYTLYKTDYPSILSDRMEKETIDGPLSRSLFADFKPFAEGTPEQYAALHTKYWQTAPVHISITGTVSQETIDASDHLFGDLPRQKAHTEETLTSAWKESLPREMHFDKASSADERHFEWLFPLPKLEPEMDVLLVQALGYLSSSRVAANCRAAGTGYSMSAHLISYSSVSHHSITGTVPTSEAALFQRTVEDTLNSYQKEPMTQDEFERAQTALRSALIRESADGIVATESIAHEKFLSGEIRTPAERAEIVKNIQYSSAKDAIHSVALGRRMRGTLGG